MRCRIDQVLLELEGGMVGGNVHITINWRDIETLNRQDGSIEDRIGVETPRVVVEELCDKLEVFRQAYEENGLRRQQYAEYGPVQLFRNAFMMGWYTLLAEVSKRRNSLAL